MINRMILQGRLTHDPELRRTKSDTAVCSFTVAWNESYKDDGRILYMPCTAWNGTAEFISKYFSKGFQILVEGDLSTRRWVDKDGNNRSNIEMRIMQVHFCDRRKNESVGANPELANEEAIPTQSNMSKQTNSKNYDYKSDSATTGESGFVDLTDTGLNDGNLPF